MAYWIIKSEPTEYTFSQLVEEKRTAWTGIKNPVARKNLTSMKPGDVALFYHTGKDKAVVGIAKVLRAEGEDVELGPVKALAEPVTLATLKEKAATKNISVVRMGRLSVGALTEKELQAVLKLSNTTL
ncbi:MAG: EVE domain-containing protein [Myxococcaceae bacterium]|nr:EVE domain-containing protein [Myxococcaceae bacterium]